MNILKYNLQDIKKIVEEKAKYQKVMLLYDNYTSETEIDAIYQTVKEFCIFNKCEIEKDCTEIYNGYKLLIFCSGINSFLKFNYDIEEFVSVFIQKDEGILPFFLNTNNTISLSERYLFVSANMLDLNAISSLYFNKFYNYLYDLLYFQFSNINFCFNEKEITQFNLVQELEQLDASMQFADIKIIKETGIDYNSLTKLNYVLICAFLSVIMAVENKSLELVDVYKVAKDNLELIDKFYAMQTNQAITKLVELNFNFLFSACKKTKENILNLLSSASENEILHIIKELKQYATHCDGLVPYLYLYNIFGY